MKTFLNRCDELSRREFAGHLARVFLGVGILPSFLHPLGARASEAGKPRLNSGSGTAKKVIYLFMRGGMSHLDTFDPKPRSDHQGPVEAIGTSVAGIQVSQHFAKTARRMDKIALVRSLHSNQGAHELGQYYMLTGYTQRGTIRHPAMGAWAVRLAGKLNPVLPGYLRIGGDSRHPGAGFMEARYGPLPIGDPSAGLQNSHRAKGISERQFNDRLRLANQLDRGFRARYNQRQVRAYADAYQDAMGLMKSQDLLAFDLGREPRAVRTAYGDNAFGQGCLLARRLIESDVRFVEVSYGGWDTHQNNFERMEELGTVLDRALSVLVADLSQRGLLAETLVVLVTEFGRTPKINQNRGRDHFPKAFSCLLAGGGVRGGQVYGATDPDGMEVVDRPVSIPDFNATIAHALGLPQDEIVTSPSGRPFTVAGKGKPLTGLFG